MTQLVTRVGVELVEQLDALVDSGVVESRSDGVRRGLQGLVDEHRRREVGRHIVGGYLRVSQDEIETGWSDSDSVRMIADESW